MSVLVTYKYVGEWVCQMEEKEQLLPRLSTIRMLTNRRRKQQWPLTSQRTHTRYHPPLDRLTGSIA